MLQAKYIGPFDKAQGRLFALLRMTGLIYASPNFSAINRTFFP